MVGRGNGKFLNHAGMIRAEVIQTTIEIGWNRYGDCTTGSGNWTTADQAGACIPITLPDHKGVTGGHSGCIKFIRLPSVSGWWKSREFARPHR